MTTVNKCNKQRRGTQLILITGVSVSDKEWHSILSNVQFEFLAKQNADMRRHAAAGSLAGLDDFQTDGKAWQSKWANGAKKPQSLMDTIIHFSWAWVLSAGLGWAGLGAGGLECSISAKTNPGAAAAAYYSITQPLQFHKTLQFSPNAVTSIRITYSYFCAFHYFCKGAA